MWLPSNRGIQDAPAPSARSRPQKALAVPPLAEGKAKRADQ